MEQMKNQEQKPKNTWGGSRGGGRPKNDRNHNLQVKVSAEALEKLNKVTRNKAEYIDNWLRNLDV